MILGIDGPVVVLDARVAAMLARPLERLVVDARRRGETIDPAVIAALADCERVRRLLVAVAGSASGTAEPDSAEPDVDSGREPDLSTTDAASLLGWSPSYLRRMARRHRLGIKVNGDWRFPLAEIVTFRDNERTTVDAMA